MRKMILVLFPFVFFAYLVSCIFPYELDAKVLPEDIKKVYVKPFSNASGSFPNLEVELTHAVVKEILEDGRICLVNSTEEADGILTGTIKYYHYQPFIYCKNMSSVEYKLQIVIDVYFIDNYKAEILWSESNMEGVYVYEPQNCSEEYVRNNIWEKFSKSIVRRTIKEFTSIS